MKQANIQVAAPGFFGVNSEASPIELSEKFCAIADNCVLDSSGRISSRKGYRVLTADNTALGTAKVQQMHEANYTDGTTVMFAVGNNKIFTFDTSGVLTDITPGGATITADYWQIVTLNDDTLFFQEGHDPIVYDKSLSTCSLLSAHTDYAGSVPQADVACAAYGRVWCGKTSTITSTLTWSDLLIPAAWTGGSSGSLDLTTLWPTGNDEIVAITAHNNKLIIFGRRNVLMFGSNAIDGKLADPNTDILLEDDIADMGCISKYGVAEVGSDLWFTDDTGVRSFGRSIRDKNATIGDISKNVRTIISSELRLETNKVRLVHVLDDNFVCCMLEGLPHVYVFDTRFPLEDGSARVTHWTGLDFSCMAVMTDGTVYFGNNDGINKYQGYTDAADSDGTNGVKYRMRYYMHPQAFGVPANLKLPKEVDFTIAGGALQQAVAFWAYDYTYQFRSQPFLLDVGTPDFYNLDEYNITDADDPTEYNSGGGIARYAIPLNGSGTSVAIALEVNVVGQKTSVQEINIQTKIGRML